MKKPNAKQLLNLQAQHESVSTKPKVQKTILALDYGEKFCGLAQALDGVTVLPLKVVKTADLLETLEAVIKKLEPEVLVIGLPLSSDGSENHICGVIRAQTEKIKQKWPDLEVELVNERFSTQATLSPDKDRIDDLAAMQILSFYLQQTKS